MDAYGYCYQNPIMLVDPDGRIPFPVNATFKNEPFRIDSWFGPRNTGLSYASKFHKGLDFNFGGGRYDYGAPVLSTHQGIATVKEDLSGNAGRMVIVTSPDGSFRTRYLHLKTTNVVDGQEINEAQVIGEIGGSRAGKEFGGQVHLHYDIQKYNSETKTWDAYNPTEGKANTKNNVVDPQTWITNAIKPASTNTNEVAQYPIRTKESLLDEYNKINTTFAYDPKYVEKRSQEIRTELNNNN
jgi:murein DD-endopeptidase MepM/ murein hydrolase activator NlpD